MKKILFVGIILFFLTACGQSGQLYLPEQPASKLIDGSKTSHE